MGKIFTTLATCVKIHAPLTTAGVLVANQMADDPAPKSNSMWVFWTLLTPQAGFSRGADAESEISITRLIVVLLESCLWKGREEKGREGNRLGRGKSWDVM